MDKYLYWLDRTVGLGQKTKRNLIEAFGCGFEVYKASDKYLKYILDEKKFSILMNARKEIEIEQSYRELQIKNINMCCFHEADYPDKLRKIPDPPFCLYYRGDLPKEKLPSVAIIGARECSSYGEYIASELGKTLGNQGIQVISGMARGIDGISQWSALEAGGISFGVLGSGVDICYPKSNKGLYEKLLMKGGILSAYPPGTKPQAKLFPPRNRIVSGLADILVVIEARQRSGTSITVEMALEQGRDIYAVPGRITDRLSDGCNKLLKEGAHVFLSPEDFLLDLESMLPIKMQELRKNRIKNQSMELQNKEEAYVNPLDDQLNGNTDAKDDLERRIMNVLDFYPQPFEAIMEKLHKEYPIQIQRDELLSKLMLMCLFGQIKQDSSSWFSKNR